MPFLICNPHTSDTKIYNLKLGVNTLGRGRDNDIVVPHESLSRRHAEIILTEDRVILSDQNSLNGIFVNEVKIHRCDLREGDLIRCGEVIFQWVQQTGIPQENRLEIDLASPATIVKQFSPEVADTSIKSLLDESENGDSILRLRPQAMGQRAVDKLKILLEVSKQLSSPEEPDRLLEKILDLLLSIMKVDRAVILLVNETTEHLESKAVKSRAGIPVDTGFYSKRITNLVRETGKAILTADAQIDERFEQSESIATQKIHASICVPLKPRAEVIGVLYADNLSRSNLYADEDVEFLAGLANQAAIAIENGRLYHQMQTEAVWRSKLERFFPESVAKKLKEEGKVEIVETEVTALFSDLSRFTEMSSLMEPRQIIEMLNEYFALMVEEIVFPFEGTLEKYIGDALVAVWGAPYQKADDPARAVKAAIAMQWSVRRLNQKWMAQGKQPIQIHIGLNTGIVAAGNIGSDKLIQYTHIGDAMNVASRICSAAKADEIMISQTTFERLSDRTLLLEKMPPIPVKGKEKPLQLYRILWENIPVI